jgi:hypothetical protein
VGIRNKQHPLKSARTISEVTRIVVGTTGGVIMVGGITWAASWYFAAANPSAWRLLPAVAMFIVGLGLILWMLRHPDPRKAVLSQLNRLMFEGGVLLFHQGQEQDVRHREWNAQVTALVIHAFSNSGTPLLKAPPANVHSPQELFQWQIDELSILRERFMAGEIGAGIKPDGWYSLP